MNSPESLKTRGHGTVIITIPGNVSIPEAGIWMFGKRCRLERACPNHRRSQCHKCQAYGHHQDTCPNGPRCAVCAETHLTTQHKCSNATFPGVAKCNHTPIRCANCPLGPAGSHKAMDRACPACTKFLLQGRPTNTHTALE